MTLARKHGPERSGVGLGRVALGCLSTLGLALQLGVAPAMAKIGEAPVDAAWMARHYLKQEVRIPMRDGTRLFTSVYRPREPSEPAPMLLTRTPYSCRPYGEDQMPEVVYPDPVLVREGYILVCQDVRGTHLSEGEWVHMRPDQPPETAGIDESSDAWDTIDWLVRNVPGNNGRVCLWGASYPGFYVAASMIDPHPALACALPQAPQIDWWYEDVHHNGAFFLAPVTGFLGEFGGPRSTPAELQEPLDFELPTRDGYRFFLEEVGGLARLDERVFGGAVGLWHELVAHPNRDAFWQARDLRPRLKPVAPAVLAVGGWYDDSNLFGSLAVYRSVEEQNPGAANTLAIGPWAHTGWEWEATGEQHGDIPFGAPTSQFYRFAIQKPFLDFYARDVGPDWDGDGRLDIPEAWVFEVGANRWRSFDQWPPAAREAHTLYLSAAGALSWSGPPPTSDGQVFDSFVSDPRHPVPFTESIVPFRDPRYMTADQRFAARRPDVLTYQSPELSEPLTLAGPIEVDLYVSTDREDADFVVKLIDVFPGEFEEGAWEPTRRASGYQMLVRGDVLRGRFRGDPASPTPFVPEQPTRIHFTLPDVLHTFLPGHRMMVQIQSTWFPLVDRNPQAWVENIYRASEDDFRSATHRVWRSSRYPSHLEVPVLPPAGDAVAAPAPARFWNPSWSRDGQWVLFEANLEGDRELDLWAVARDRVGIHRVLERAQQGAWSPDGNKLAYIHELEGNLEIFVADADGSNAVNVSQDEHDTYIPRWSPDGRWIAFVRRSAPESRIHDLWIMSAEGGDRRRLTESSTNEIGISWAPDASELAFGSDRSGSFDIYSIGLEGTETRRLTDSESRDMMPAWSPDGSTIAFASDREGSMQIYRMDREGGDVHRVTGLSGRALMPAWSPDGEWIAFIGEHEGRWGVFVVRPDGSGLERLTPAL